MAFCTNCGQEIPAGAKFCVNCGTLAPASGPMLNPAPHATAQPIYPASDELAIASHMSEGQRMVYLAEKKDATVALLLCLFLGGLGAHKFYLGKVGLGVLYILFCWTFIPIIVSFVELFLISGQVRTYNRELALRITQGGTR